jgi:hypothetical protein
MRKQLGVLLLSLLSIAQAKAKDLPDSCGDNKVQFDVNLQKDKPFAAVPETGKAQVVFIEDLEKSGTCFHCITTTRVGMDGAWVGANEGDSYFAVSASPGEHNLCTDIQSKNGALILGMATFTVETGKTYYYKVKVIFNELDGPSPYSDLELLPIGADEAKYRLKTSALSTAMPHP